MICFTSALVSIGMLFALPISVEKRPREDQNTIFERAVPPHARPNRMPPVIAGKPNLAACLQACEAGTKAIENFCRSLPPDPEMRAACWAVTLGSVPACKGFCYAWFVVG